MLAINVLSMPEHIVLTDLQQLFKVLLRAVPSDSICLSSHDWLSLDCLPLQLVFELLQCIPLPGNEDQLQESRDSHATWQP